MTLKNVVLSDGINTFCKLLLMKLLDIEQSRHSMILYEWHHVWMRLALATTICCWRES